MIFSFDKFIIMEVWYFVFVSFRNLVLCQDEVEVVKWLQLGVNDLFG